MLFMLEKKHNDVLINSKKCRLKLSISQDDFDVHDDEYMLAKIISYASKSKIIPWWWISTKSYIVIKRYCNC